MIGRVLADHFIYADLRGLILSWPGRLLPVSPLCGLGKSASVGKLPNLPTTPHSSRTTPATNHEGNKWSNPRWLTAKS
jgi:hypothetical protein